MKCNNLSVVTIAILMLLVPSGVFSLGHKDDTTRIPPEVTDAAILPITEVTLFTTGLGFYNRSGTIENDRIIDLYFNNIAVDDLLKSMILQDSDGGRIRSVNYGLPESSSGSPEAGAIDISSNPGVLSLLEQARGKAVSLSLKDGAVGFRGRIFGIEYRSSPAGGQTAWINLLSGSTLTSVAFENIVSLRFLDPVVENRLHRALSDLSGPEKEQKTRVSLHCEGQGSRRVSVGYILPAPVWKTTYRISLGTGNEHYIQAWAIIHNTSDDDWKNIALSLVSGRPVSFSMNLRTPVTVRRPALQAPVSSGAGARSYEKAVPDMAMRSEVPSAPAMIDEYGSFDRNRYTVEPEGMDLSRGVSGSAETEEAGEFYRYSIRHPVSLAASETAMVPVVTGSVEGERFALYNAAVDPVHPYNAFLLKNTTGVNLLGGPITLFEDNTYAGDAMLPSLQAGEEQMISYSLDLITTVRFEDKPAEETLVYAGFSRGTLVTRTLYSQERAYTLESKAGTSRRIILEHPKRNDWTLTVPEEAYETTASLYRFILLPADNPFSVIQERTVETSISLESASDVTIQNIILDADMPVDIKESLGVIIEKRASLRDTQRLIRDLETERSRIFQDQARIRENLARLEPGTELHDRYLSLLDQQESRLAEILGEKQDLEGKARNEQNALGEYINALDSGE